MTVEKVLHILPMNQLSGAEKMALLICKHLTKYEPIVVTGGEVLKKVFEKEGIQTYSISFSKSKFPLTLHQLNQTIKVHKIKLIHAHDNTATLAAYLTKRLYRLDVKVISHVHSCYPWLIGDNLNKKIDSYLRPRVDYNILCGELVKDHYVLNSDYFDKDSSYILSNAIDTTDLIKLPQINIQKIKNFYGIQENDFIFGFIGRLTEAKGLIPFIKEFVNFKGRFNDCKILLVGSGEQEGEIKQLIQEHSLQEYFIFTGFQEDIKQFYQLIDVFFLPSVYEGLPMVILEAMVNSLPVVSMNVGSIGELLKDDRGVLVYQGEYKQFIEEMIKLKNQVRKRSLLSRRGHKFVCENYGIASYQEKLESLYEVAVIGG